MEFEEYPDFGEDGTIKGKVYVLKDVKIFYFPRELIIKLKLVDEGKNFRGFDVVIISEEEKFRSLDSLLRGFEEVGEVEVDKWKLREIANAYEEGRKQEVGELLSGEDFFRRDRNQWDKK